MQNLIGQVLRGYYFEESLAEGGQGAVFRAHQQVLNRRVAIKVILPERSQDADAIARFEQEAQFLLHHEHAHIIPLYDYWRDEQGIFLVMRLIKRGSLQTLLAAHKTLTLVQVERLYDQLSQAVDAAHSAGVIHRDIKPNNILIDDDYNVYLTDFGIAKQNTRSDDLTPDGAILGTPRYISPEQISGDPITFGTDIYSMGIMLYELLAGEHPFNTDSITKLYTCHLNELVPELTAKKSEMPVGLNAVIWKATSKQAVDRYGNVRDFYQALVKAVHPNGTAPRPQSARQASLPYVFISYSRQNRTFVNRLVYDLRAEDLKVWIDADDLHPGTLQWEQAIRDAIAGSWAVLYIVTPQSRQSRYVPDELAIADMYERHIIPVWAEGMQYADSVLLGRGSIQRVDARGEAYVEALPEILAVLQRHLQPEDYVAEGNVTETDVQGGAGFRTPQAPRSIQPVHVQRNPYKGLRAFQTKDHEDFFGRDDLIATLVKMVAQVLADDADAIDAARLVGLIGPSGSGKSSVARAGLLSRLQNGALPQSEGWLYLPPLIPGENPIEALVGCFATILTDRSADNIRSDLHDTDARGLHLLAGQAAARGGASQVVLLIDQFEELFAGDAPQIEQIINLLITAMCEPDGPLLVILTLRADYYDRPMAYPEFMRLLSTHHTEIPPMTLENLYQVIMGPAQNVGLAFESGLVAEIVFDVRQQPGGLPLLEFTLDELYRRAQQHHITRALYQEIGGVHGALARHAERVYNEMLPSDAFRNLARVLFSRLSGQGITPDSVVRRRVEVKDLASGDDMRDGQMAQVIKIFTDDRLLVAGEAAGNTIEVAHEALFSAWDRLAGWLSDDPQFRRWHERFNEDVGRWRDRKGWGIGDLYIGGKLAEANRWHTRYAEGGEFSSHEINFLRFSTRFWNGLRGFAGVVVVILALISAIAIGSEARLALLRNAARSPVVIFDPATALLGRAETAVDLPKFALDVHEVTYGQYARCVEMLGCITPFYPELPTDQDNHPVTHVNAFQARQFCEWIGRRLPTAAEWQRGASGLRGDEWPDDPDALSRADFNIASSEYRPTGTSDVNDAQFAADRTSEGLSGMAGNVSEWTATPTTCEGADRYTCATVWNGESAVALYAMGGAWLATWSNDRNLSALLTSPSELVSTFESAAFGFRCASTE